MVSKDGTVLELLEIKVAHNNIQYCLSKISGAPVLLGLASDSEQILICQE
jgi:hypothetical protein